LNYKPGDHLDDLIAHSGGKITLAPGAPPPILTMTLVDALYWRLASFTPKKDWAALAAEIRGAKPGTGAILDLRSNEAPDDYAGAAQVAAYFRGDASLLNYVPKGGDNQGLPKLPALNPYFAGPVVVLVDAGTTGAAAALAASLKAGGALVIGQPAIDTASWFGEHKFGNGQILRFPTTAPDGTPPTVPAVLPDITLTLDQHNEKEALALIRDGRATELIEELPMRHRMSEASLVKDDDPEWDDYLAALEKPVLLSLPQVHDAALVAALDSLRAIQFSQAPPPAATALPAAPSSL
jgi:hypothetical protein